MSSERGDQTKEWGMRRAKLVKEKERYLKNPRSFAEEMFSMGKFLREALRFSRPIEETCLGAALELTGGMRPEEIDVLRSGLTDIWNSEICEQSETTEKIMYRIAINSLMAMQEARKVTCVKMVPDL